MQSKIMLLTFDEFDLIQVHESAERLRKKPCKTRELYC